MSINNTTVEITLSTTSVRSSAVTPQEKLDANQVVTGDALFESSLLAFPEGGRVEVYWTEEKAWYAGRVVKSWCSWVQGR